MGMSGTFPCLSLLLSLLNLEFDRRKAIKSTAPGGEGVGGVVPLPIGTAAAEPCNPTPALTCGGVEEPGGPIHAFAPNTGSIAPWGLQSVVVGGSREMR